MLLKAISIKQPFADWIQRGLKTIEVRSWQPGYLGDLVICSTKHIAHELNYQPDHDLLLGHALCIVELTHVTKFTPEHVNDALCAYRIGEYAWHLKFKRTIKPFPILGVGGKLFTINHERLRKPDYKLQESDIWRANTCLK